MVYRIFVEKKPALAKEAHDLLHEVNELLGIGSLPPVCVSSTAMMWRISTKNCSALR